MTHDDMAYCGLNCETCQRNFADIRQQIARLDDAFEKVNVKAMVKAIPLMTFKYWGYRKLTTFFNNACPGCRNNGGNPFCGIRKCATKKGYFTCAECHDLCKKFDSLFKIHTDREVQTNIEQLREIGIEEFVERHS